MFKKIALVSAGIIPAFAGVFGSLVVHAQVPDPTTMGTYAATSTDTAAAYVTNTIFGGGVLKYLLFIGILAVVIWFVKAGLHKLVG